MNFRRSIFIYILSFSFLVMAWEGPVQEGETFTIEGHVWVKGDLGEVCSLQAGDKIVMLELQEEGYTADFIPNPNILHSGAVCSEKNKTVKIKESELLKQIELRDNRLTMIKDFENDFLVYEDRGLKKGERINSLDTNINLFWMSELSVKMLYGKEGYRHVFAPNEGCYISNKSVFKVLGFVEGVYRDRDGKSLFVPVLKILERVVEPKRNLYKKECPVGAVVYIQGQKYFIDQLHRTFQERNIKRSWVHEAITLVPEGQVSDQEPRDGVVPGDIIEISAGNRPNYYSFTLYFSNRFQRAFSKCRLPRGGKLKVLGFSDIVENRAIVKVEEKSASLTFSCPLNAMMYIETSFLSRLKARPRL